MSTVSVQKPCATGNQPCVEFCPGYGSRTNCPPLIVLAVVALMPTPSKH